MLMAQQRGQVQEFAIKRVSNCPCSRSFGNISGIAVFVFDRVILMARFHLSPSLPLTLSLAVNIAIHF